MDKEYAEYLLNKTKNDYNLISEDFSRTREKVWEEIKFLFDDYLTAGEKVLDLGCGNARFYDFFKEKDIQYFGLDNSEKLIGVAQQKYPQVNFRIGNALNLPFPNNYFDKIYSIAVLHRIPSKELRSQFLNETERTLKSGGKLILIVWKLPIKKYKRKNISLLIKYTIFKIIGISKLDFKDILEPWGNKTFKYYHWFSKRELAKIVKKAGLKIERIGVMKNKTGNRQNIYLIAEKRP